MNLDHEKFNISMRKFLKKVGVTSQQKIEEAVRIGIENNLMKNSNIIQNNVKNKNLEICAGYYSLSNGHVDIFSNTNQDGLM